MTKTSAVLVFIVISVAGYDVVGQCFQTINLQPSFACPCQCGCGHETFPAVTLPFETVRPVQMQAYAPLTKVEFKNKRTKLTVATNESQTHNLFYRITNSGNSSFLVMPDRVQNQRWLRAGETFDVVFSKILTIRPTSEKPPMTGSYEFLAVVPK